MASRRRHFSKSLEHQAHAEIIKRQKQANQNRAWHRIEALERGRTESLKNARRQRDRIAVLTAQLERSRSQTPPYWELSEETLFRLLQVKTLEVELLREHLNRRVIRRAVDEGKQLP
jgi:hypothetical protein